jgi:signal transduction histidine kinase
MSTRGLALCKQICDLHDALINVTSELNKGTEFEIKFTTLPHLDDNSAK